MVFETRSKDGETGLKAFFQLIKAFLSTQRDNILVRRSSPPLHGINLIQGDPSPPMQGEPPGYDSLTKRNERKNQWQIQKK